MAYYRNYRNYPQYQKKEKTYKSYLHLSYKEICDKEEYFLERYNKISSLAERYKIHFADWLHYIEKLNELKNTLDKEIHKNKEYTDAYWKIHDLKNDIENRSLLSKVFFQEKENEIKKEIEIHQKKIDILMNEKNKKIEHWERFNFVEMPAPFKESVSYKVGNKEIKFELNSKDFPGIHENKSEKELLNINEYLKPIQKAKEMIKKRFDEQQSQIKRANDETAKHKAHSYAYQEKTRELAEEVKREIKSQLRKFKVCPYCEGDLGDVPHADHIYPVSKGGLSTKENMVYICQSCNSSKSDKTLNVFIKSKGFDRDKVEGNLDLLGKDY